MELGDSFFGNDGLLFSGDEALGIVSGGLFGSDPIGGLVGGLKDFFLPDTVSLVDTDNS